MMKLPKTKLNFKSRGRATLFLALYNELFQLYDCKEVKPQIITAKMLHI